jgi:serine/threonine-protein kinase
MTETRDSSRLRIGPFEVVGAIARGATCEVVKALDSAQGRTVAIKILSPGLVGNPDALARFERESHALTELQHPNIARVYGSGIAPDGRPYFALEFVEGQSLMGLILDKVEMPLAQQLDLMIQAAEGLRAAFQSNIIHRDVKPANLMVETGSEKREVGDGTRKGRNERLAVGQNEEAPPEPLCPPSSSFSRLSPPASPQLHLKIVDFGLAKIVREDASQKGAGLFMGTPRYMAPEVVLGRPADHRSDIYSLGATFYHLLTGRPPYDGDTPAAVMDQHVRSPLTPPHLFNPEIPADVSDIVEKAMAKEPGHRYHDYDELLSDLKSAKMACVARERQNSGASSAEGQPAESPVEISNEPSGRPARQSFRRWALVAVAVVVLLAGAFYVSQWRPLDKSSRLLPTLVRTLLDHLGKKEAAP